MICIRCLYTNDESEFNSTETPGERLCPQCGNSECYEFSSIPECRCDSTHEQNKTVCRFCWARGYSWPGEKEVRPPAVDHERT